MTAVFAGLLTKVGVYVLLRLSTLLFSPAAGISAGLGNDWLAWGGMATLAFGALGMLVETSMLRRLYRLDHLYGLLLTFGITLLTQDLVKQVMLSKFAVSSAPYTPPEVLSGVVNLGFVVFPKYRLFVIALSLVAMVVKYAVGTPVLYG
mgnify:CR=1 FL=1